MRKTTLRMLSLLTAFVMTFTSVDMAVFADEVSPEEVVVTAETTEASTVSVEEDSSKVEEITSDEGETAEESDSEEMTTTETEEETATEETTTEELMLEEDGRYSEKLTDAVTLVQKKYYQNENGNYDIFILTYVPGMDGGDNSSYSIKMYVDGKICPANYENGKFYLSYSDYGTNLCIAKMELKDISLNVGNHNFKAEIDCYKRTPEGNFGDFKNGYIEGTLVLSEEKIDYSTCEAANTVPIYSKDSAKTYTNATFALDKDDDIAKDIPVLVSATDSSVRVTLAKHSIYNSSKSDYTSVTNSKYVYDMEIDGQTISFSENKSGIFVGSNIEVPYDQLEPGVYNLEYKTKKGKTLTILNAVEIIKDKTVITSVSSALSGIYVCDSNSDYIAFVVYGNNIPDDLVPKFYMDQNMTETAGDYVSKSPDLGDGRVYKILKSDALKANKSGTIFFKFEGHEEKGDILYRGYNNVIKQDDEIVGLMGGYYVSPITHVLFQNKKVLKIYMSGKAFSGDVTGDLIEVYNQAYVNGKQVVKSYLGTISKNTLGEYYVEVPTNEAVFSAIALCGYGCVKYGEGDTGWNEGFQVTNNATIPVLKNLTVSAGSWKLLYPDMSKATSGKEAGTNLLSTTELVNYSKQAYMILEETVDGKTKTTQVIFTSGASDVDKIICHNGEDSWTVEVAKGETLSLNTPDVPNGVSEDDNWKNNHTFEGWYLKSDTDYTNKKESVAGEGGKTVELVAYWRPTIYRVSIYPDSEEGSVALKVFDLPYDGTILLNRETLGIEGHEGYKLYLGNGESSTEEGYFDYEDCCDYGENFASNEIKFYCSYSPIYYEIKYHTNGVYISGSDCDNTYYTVEDEIITLPDLSDEKYELSEEFLGWYTDASFDEDKKITIIPKGSYGDIDLYAKWGVRTYTLKFDANIESYEGLSLTSAAISDMEKKYGEVFNLPANSYSVKPSDSNDKTKWAFAGWSLRKTNNIEIFYYPKGKVSFDEEAYCDPGNTDDDDIITLYAIYQKIIPISYNADGGLLPEDAKTEHVLGEKAYTLPIPSKAGYDFLGWYIWENGDYNKKITSVTDKNVGTVSVFAKWKEKTYKVTLNPNGGKGKTVTKNVDYEESLDLSGFTDYTKTGFVFDGFALEDAMGNKLNNFSPRNYESLANSKTGSKVILKARWKPEDYTIEYEANGGTLEGYTQTYQYAVVNTPSLKIPAREGYTFAGWYFDAGLKKTAGSYKNGTFSLAKGTTGDITLYAKWTRDYKLVLHEDDSDTSKVETYTGYKYETAKAIATPKFKKANMTLVGWHIAGSADKEYDAKEKIAGIEPDEAGEVHLYAIWKSNKYTINYYNSYEYNSQINYSLAKPQTANAGKQVALIKNPITKTGYALMGWTTTQGSNTVEYDNGAKVDLTMVASDNVVNLYPVWRNSFEITFEKNATNASISRTKYTYYYGHEIKDKSFALISTPARNGYVFSGWYTDEACKKAFKKITTTQTGDITLYAKWTPTTYNVTYVANVPYDCKYSGTMKTQKLTYLKSTALSKNAYKAPGFTFAGWSTSPYYGYGETYANGEKVTCIGSDYRENVTLYAVWDSVQYSITYNNVKEFNASNSNQITYSVYSPTIKLKCPEKRGYAFKGWYSDKACKKRIYEIPTGTTGNITLYAKWELIK